MKVTPLKAFIVGSSLPCVIISLAYIGNGWIDETREEEPVPFEYVAIAIPLLFGLWNAGALSVSKLTRMNMTITGLLFGIFLSNVGTHVLNAPVDVFEFPEHLWYVPMILAPFLYAFVWGVIVYAVNKQFF